MRIDEIAKGVSKNELINFKIRSLDDFFTLINSITDVIPGESFPKFYMDYKVRNDYLLGHHRVTCRGHACSVSFIDQGYDVIMAIVVMGSAIE